MTTMFFNSGREDPRYGDDRHSDLPWGYWLVSAADVPGRPPLLDEQGREWDSVREAFWKGRLGLPEIYSHASNEIMEFMAGYLAIMDGRFVPTEERVQDIFQGDRHLDLFFTTIMRAAGLIDARNGCPTAEGRAVLAMLIATRNRDDAEHEIGLDWIRANRTVVGHGVRRQTAEAVERGERVAARMAHRFATGDIGREPCIKLIGVLVTREIPVRSTIWSMTWPEGDRYARDRFYLWLLERIDRWDDWAAMVVASGARSLTEHLLRLAFCDRPPEGVVGTDDVS
ncbi:hypothetical protein [Qipengyuania spongiae]|uniref:Uncharacterized protein n=1 Tax=Qipengyuania spongiae TaxID=2909673 RepID=A0ABY5SV29_9SPHN|nr:hypothetical protein [Qipengyuania spongiae]UVI38402.1 hypothetical protein L1F33_09020 [Qipengyuania spongiae]